MTIIRFTLLASALWTGCLSAQTPAPPANVAASGYDSHIELHWQPSNSPNITGYQVFRSTDGSQFDLLQSVGPSTRSIIDWTGDEGQALTRHYKVRATAALGALSDFSEPASATTAAMSDEQLMDMVQQYTFRYFWDFAHPLSGLARERSNGDNNIVTTGGSGFGIMAIVVATERGWVTREAAVNRMIQIISFLQLADRFHGVFPHWLNGSTGKAIPFSQYDDGGDLVETAFLMQGLLTARQYFDQNTPLENALRNAITGLWEAVEWDWYRKNGSGTLYWHWSPNHGWQMNFPLRGFNETHITYLLAAASPTHGVPGSLYQTGWTAGNYANASTYYGYPIFCGPPAGGPLFFAHYSYLGFDPRNVKDAFCNYFQRNRNHSLIQHAYSINNPSNFTGYSAECWGLTSSDDPITGYREHHPGYDNGTIAPTAALSSMPYTPSESLAALRHFYRAQGERLWGQYGFYDAFNLKLDWFASSYLAIDQGPIVVMLENHRTGLLWDLFMQNPEIQPALEALGFQPDASGTQTDFLGKNGFDVFVFPNPIGAEEMLNVECSILAPQKLTLRIIDTQGRPVRALFQDMEMPAGLFQKTLHLKDLPQGIYFLEMTGSKGGRWTGKVMVK
ncbi:MAG: T9SS type A sorting domain-containing protein [Saprospiraceae bacterium]|nr:T9SS type A sorting domain-containing protein [Saprospiraceae bacterium]